MTGPGWRQGALAGGVAGLALVAGNYLLDVVGALAPLPELLQQPLLEAMPGWLFGFLIDTLQHAGKVLEEIGLIAAFVLALAVVGAVHGMTVARRPRPYLGMAFGAVGWALVMVVLLPLSGKGLFGLADGITVPLLWALLFAIYGFLLDTLSARALDADADADRRAVLRLPLTVAAVSVGLLALRLVPGWYRAVFAAPESGLRGPPAALTPVANFYVVSKNFSDPIVDSRSWKLSIHGKVERPFSLGYDAFHALPATTETATLECVSNNVGGDLISTGLFAGPPLRDLVAMASPSGDADAVALRSRDGYTETIALGLVGGDASILVAHTLDGAPLPDRHGFPARVLFPGHYGMRGPKWLEDIELVKGDGGGYWEGQGWSHDATVKTTARIDTPADGATLARGAITIAGVAFAGTRGISAVEVSTDRGRSWRPAELGETPSPLSWTLWTFAWTPASGAYTVVVRARDGSGALQSAIVAPSFPSGASGYHSIHVNVT